MPPAKQVTLYTDGSCLGNPGPGGYAAIVIYGEHRKEISGGFLKTTNNRMELTAAIVGLQTLRQRCDVVLFSDSEYLVNAMSKGWAKRWKSTGWRRNHKERALNPDLWDRLLDLCDDHKVEFKWVRGHAGHPENERCDELAAQAANRSDLPLDESYAHSLEIT